MFQSARLKLTGWYLLIIMLISIIFSLIIYTVINEEYTKIERNQKIRQDRLQQGLSPFYEQFRLEREQQGQHIPPVPTTLDPQFIHESRVRLQIILLLVNVGILIISGIAGYFLAGRTLRPIQKMVEEQNRFITDASHELRTPLTSLKTSIEVYLRNKIHTMKDSDNLLRSNLEEVNSLQYLSDNLIKLTHFQKTDDRLIFERVSVFEIINEAGRKVANLAKQKNIKIINHVKKSIILGDKQSLTELFVILLDNAVKYSFKNKSVTITSEISENHIAVKIKDEGIGIEDKDIPYIFDRFYRADKSRTKENAEGYGLGLSIAQQIIDNHNGQIRVESKSGKGSAFSIHFPVKYSQ